MPRGIRDISDVLKQTAFLTGYLMTGLNFSMRDDGWLLVVKVRSKKGGHLVTFIHAHSPEDCLDYLWEAMHRNDVKLKWREDKWKSS